LRHAQAIGAIAHWLCRLIWKILYQGIQCEERGPDNKQSKAARARKMIRELRSLGYRSNSHVPKVLASALEGKH
jgi:hypothetical protein